MGREARGDPPGDAACPDGSGLSVGPPGDARLLLSEARLLLAKAEAALGSEEGRPPARPSVPSGSAVPPGDGVDRSATAADRRSAPAVGAARSGAAPLHEVDAARSGAAPRLEATSGAAQGFEATSRSDHRSQRRRLTATGAFLALAACVGLGLTAGGASELVAARAAQPVQAARRLPDRPALPAATATTPAADSLGDAVPTALSIPKLGSSAPVTQAVQVLANGPEAGLLSAPDDYHDLGWYRHSPGGILVLDGHVGYRSSPGPLTYIGQLQEGDAIVVSYGLHARSYRVVAVASVLKGRLPASYFSAAYDGWLMLITCDYNSPFHAGHFANNVYVLATPSE